MEYTDEIADLIVERFGLLPNAKKVWKVRGKIPDMYMDPDYQKPRKLDDRGLYIQDKLFTVLDNEKLNVREMCRLAKVEYQAWMDAKRKQNNMNEQNMIALRKNLNELRIKLKPVVESQADKKYYSEREKKALLDLLKDKRLVLKPLLALQQLEYERVVIARSKQQTQNLSARTHSHIVNQLAILIIETAV